MVAVSTVTRFEPTGAMPLIDVPVAVTVTDSVETSCARACPVITLAIALKDAPHKSLFKTRLSRSRLKIIGYFPFDWLFGSASKAQALFLCSTVPRGQKPVKQMLNMSLAL